MVVGMQISWRESSYQMMNLKGFVFHFGCTFISDLFSLALLLVVFSLDTPHSKLEVLEMMCVCVDVSACANICMSVCEYVVCCLSVCLSLSVCLPACLPVCLSVCVCMYVCAL